MTRSSNCFGDFGGVKSCWGYKFKVVNSQNDHNNISNDTLLKYARIFTFKELQKATDNFGTKSVIGRGGFSTCYKGTIDNGSVVAIKVLDNRQGFDFVSFINMMSVIRHRNVAQFVGYCVEGDRLIVVHEFVGSYGLHELLFDRGIKEEGSVLSWSRRASICIGIARGIEYLHEGASHRVVHRDIKPSNILLDDNFNPKIVDFEVAELFDDDVSHHSGNIVGTIGYIDPEYIITGKFSEKVDVYGFGILLLEIISGKRDLDLRRERELSDKVVSLVDWAWEVHETGMVLDFVDPTLTDIPEDEVKRFIDVALSCVQSSANLRPRMSEALLMLLGGYDFGNKELRNPKKHAMMTSSFHGEYYRHDEKSDEMKVTMPHSDAISPVHVSTRKQDLVARNTVRRAPKHRATNSMSKPARGFEIEIESDPDTHSTNSELMEISHDLETEMYGSIEENAAKPELVSPSLNSGMHNSLSSSTDIHVQEEVDATKQSPTSQAPKQVQMSRDLEDEVQSNEPSSSVFDQIPGEEDVRATSSAQIDSLVHNEVIDKAPYRAEMSKIEEIEMENLSDAEAWALFCSQVGNLIESSEINPYARAIYKECHGSPVIISAIGSALRAESSVEEWKAALNNLQLRQNSLADERYSSRQCIQYCYDRLKARDVKTGFLYCASFPQDQEIDISMLVECLVSEGCVGGTTIAAYKRGHDIVRHLINASLLESGINGIRMHNVIRDSALEIILSDYPLLVGLSKLEKDGFQPLATSLGIRHNSMTRAGAHLKDSPTVEEWEQATMIFLMDNELSTLPSKPSCLNLVALFLQRNCSLRVIPDSFFDTMSNLKLLNLSETRIKSLPDSFSSLASLQILVMRDCERMISFPPPIGLLKSLEVLDLQGTEITHLPDNVSELESLKQLRVSFYGTMNVREQKKLPAKLVSDKILSKLGLIELGMFVYPGDQRWTLSASCITEEISCLKLSVLHFHFPNIEDLEIFILKSQSWTNGELTAFKLIVGSDFKRAVSSVSSDTKLLYNESERCLRFVNGESIPTAVVVVLRRATAFYLDHHIKISNLSQFGIECFNGLKICILRDCPVLEGLIDSEKYMKECFPSLEYLSINYMWKLKGIWGSHLERGSFTRLRYLSINACQELSYVLTSSMIGILSNLEELIIEDCVSLKYVVIEDEEIPSKDVNVKKSRDVNAREHHALCSLKVLKLHYLPEICGIWRAKWPPVEHLSFYDVPKLRNLHMKGIDVEHINEIAAEMTWWDSLEWDETILSTQLHTRVTQINIDEL